MKIQNNICTITSTAPILDGSRGNCNLYLKTLAYEIPYPPN